MMYECQLIYEYEYQQKPVEKVKASTPTHPPAHME